MMVHAHVYSLSILQPFWITALPEGQNCHKVHELSKIISAKWRAMTPDEQKVAVVPLVQKLKDAKKENNALVRNGAICAFHDACTTWLTVKTEVSVF